MKVVDKFVALGSPFLDDDVEGALIDLEGDYHLHITPLRATKYATDT